MNAIQIRTTEKEARRFISASVAALAELEREQQTSFITGTRKSGALRRASLDLTRSLADLRR